MNATPRQARTSPGLYRGHHQEGPRRALRDRTARLRRSLDHILISVTKTDEQLYGATLNPAHKDRRLDMYGTVEPSVSSRNEPV
jgi:hypothetical protein